MVALDGQVVEELRRRQQLAAFVQHGVLVFRMVQDSPADRAGIRPGKQSKKIRWLNGPSGPSNRLNGATLGLIRRNIKTFAVKKIKWSKTV